MAGQTFSHVNTPSKQGETKNNYCACVRLSVTQMAGNHVVGKHATKPKSYFKNQKKSERKPVYFQKAKCFLSYTTKKSFSWDKYLYEASLLKNFKTSVF